MATCGSSEDDCEYKREDRRQKVMLGELPSDFLRISPLSAEQQKSLDEQAAMALQQKYTMNTGLMSRLTISVVEARLNKNYGLTRMDPYVRLKIEDAVYETNTDYNGARNPRWNKNFNCCLYSHENVLRIEVYDERAFSLDELVAWVSYTIPDKVFKGDTINEWIELTGKLGPEKEGTINLVISAVHVPAGALIHHSNLSSSFIPLKSASESVPAHLKQPELKSIPEEVLAPQPTFSEEDINQVKEMFPDISEEVVKAVMESKAGNKDLTINTLLELSEVT